MLLAEAGRGARARVFEAYDMELDRRVALKLSRPRTDWVRIFCGSVNPHDVGYLRS